MYMHMYVCVIHYVGVYVFCIYLCTHVCMCICRYMCILPYVRNGWVPIVTWLCIIYFTLYFCMWDLLTDTYGCGVSSLVHLVIIGGYLYTCDIIVGTWELLPFCFF